MNRNTWGDRLELYSSKLGQRIRPYDLRHFFATESLRAGPNIHALRVALGHAGLHMAQRYLHLVEEDIKDWHKQSSPLNIVLPQKSRVRKSNMIESTVDAP